MLYNLNMLNLDKEKTLFKQGYKIIAGIDEAGRGPLAGPVVAACVIIDETFDVSKARLEEVKDSKLLSQKQREELFSIIKKQVLGIGIGVCSHKTIDKINILQASLLACKKTLKQLETQPNYLLIDGKFKIPDISTPQEAIISGDSQIFSIAAASIIAKVTRDYLMTQAHLKFPNYGFDRHKGYGTKAHLECLKLYGNCPIHRLSFAPCKTTRTSNLKTK